MADRASALPEVIAMRCARVRTAVAGPIAAVLVACAAVAPVLAGAASADDAPAPLPWYQVEVVLFAQDAAGALTDENLRTDETPVWPPRALALAPPYPEPVRPATLAELAALWNDATSVPQLQQVTPGLLPEDELLIRWLRRQSRNGRATGLDWQYGLDALVWLEPERPVDGDADLRDDDGAPLAASTSADADIGAAGSGSGPGSIDDATEPNADPVDPLDPMSAALAEVPTTSAEGLAAADAPGTEPEEETEPPAPEDIPIPAELAFRELSPDARLLNGEVRRLERTSSMRVLTQFAWRQPFEADAPGHEVRVLWRDPIDGEAALVGTIAIDLRRFLHARLNLYWRTQDADGAPVWTHIESTRRMRSGELHYIDHPQIGALIRIERFMLAEPLTPEGPVVAAPLQ